MARGRNFGTMWKISVVLNQHDLRTSLICPSGNFYIAPIIKIQTTRRRIDSTQEIKVESQRFWIIQKTRSVGLKRQKINQEYQTEEGDGVHKIKYTIWGTATGPSVIIDFPTYFSHKIYIVFCGNGTLYR